MIHRLFIGMVLFWAFSLVVGCGARPEAKLPPTPDVAHLLKGSTLGPGDVIAVRVFEEENLSNTYRLAADGTINMPLIGVVTAMDLTPEKLESAIEGKLRDGYLRNPQVTVLIKEANSRKVFVLGEVRKPGTFRYEDKMTIVQAVTLAGGLKELAAGDRVVLTRVVDDAEQKFVIPFGEISQGKSTNVLLQPGDIVFVPESWL